MNDSNKSDSFPGRVSVSTIIAHLVMESNKGLKGELPSFNYSLLPLLGKVYVLMVFLTFFKM